MSLVGPRPERPELMAEISARLPHFAQRLNVKAGMTGWAQLHGQRGDAPFESRLQLDLDYLSRWSLLLDCRILLLTLSGGFLSKKAF
jgi:lipopolysaccharide/colanic/teichoic acid biosynthesis glycosyltransferase